jgi:hypothetical protein
MGSLSSRRARQIHAFRSSPPTPLLTISVTGDIIKVSESRTQTRNRQKGETMNSTLTAERTEQKALSVAGNGATAQGLQTAQSLYRRIAALASELGKIERELRDSQGWLHEGLCDCDQCLHELRRQRQLLQARAQLLAELDTLNAAVDTADVETECLRCCQPFVPIDDEQLCEQCWLAEYGPRR